MKLRSKMMTTVKMREIMTIRTSRMMNTMMTMKKKKR